MGNSGLAVSKVVARLAGVGLDQISSSFLNDCFKQFGISVMPTAGDPVELFSRQKFEGCVVRLYGTDAETILSAARNSSSNRRMVIYGIARNTQEALRFASYGINAIFDEPLERSSVLKVVRSTHLLVIHELRRYVRIPVVMETSIDNGGPRKLMTVGQEVSAGGMSLRSETKISPTEPVRLLFTLPGVKPIEIRAVVCWSRLGENTYGFRFDPDDPSRQAVKRWIDQYLEIM